MNATVIRNALPSIIVLASIGCAPTFIAPEAARSGGGSPRGDGGPVFEARAWPEADELFRRDRRWVGGDGAYTIDLGADRTLWLFGDSLIDPGATGRRTSPDVVMVSNSVAIQNGSNPANATIEFHWGTDDDGRARAFFPDWRDHRHWPGHGVMLRDRLVLFLMRVRSVETGLGFEVHDWDAIMVMNPEASPALWDIRRMNRPANDLQVIVGSAGVLVFDDFVYAFSSREPSGGDAYLLRWPEARLHRGDLDDPEWWSGSVGWTIAGDPEHAPVPILRRAATEFTVHRDPGTGCFLQVQCTGFGAADLEVRRAPSVTGPWSEPTRLHRPAEHPRAGIMIYQGKAHPQFEGDDLVATYSTNCFDFAEMMSDDDVYFPRFVRLRRVRPVAEPTSRDEPRDQ